MPARTRTPHPQFLALQRDRRAVDGPTAKLRSQIEAAGGRHLRDPADAASGRASYEHRRATRRGLPVLGDFFAALSVFWVLAAFSVGAGPLDSGVPWLAAVLFVVLGAVQGVYGTRWTLAGEQLSRSILLLKSAALSAWACALAAEAVAGSIPLGQLALATALLPIAGIAVRAVSKRVISVRPERVVILGTGLVARRAAEVSQQAGRNVHLVGQVGNREGMSISRVDHLGSVEDLPNILRDHDVDRLVVAFSNNRDGDLVQPLRDCDDQGVGVDIVPRMFELIGLEPRVTAIGDLPVVHVPGHRLSPGAARAKRAFDVTLTSTLLLALAPLMAIAALAVLASGGGPIIYRQRRIGRLGLPFDVIKFRTMVSDADCRDSAQIEAVRRGRLNIEDAVAGIKDGTDSRVTRVGRFLRRTSLDELPQLWNVVRGDMSLVGPRPLRPFEVEQLHAWQLVRQDVRPGITGLWQVVGRSQIRWDERMQLDYSYVRHWSPMTDLRILAETLPAVLAGSGAR